MCSFARRGLGAYFSPFIQALSPHRHCSYHASLRGKKNGSGSSGPLIPRRAALCASSRPGYLRDGPGPRSASGPVQTAWPVALSALRCPPRVQAARGAGHSTRRCSPMAYCGPVPMPVNRGVNCRHTGGVTPLRRTHRTPAIRCWSITPSITPTRRPPGAGGPGPMPVNQGPECSVLVQWPAGQNSCQSCVRIGERCRRPQGSRECPAIEPRCAACGCVRSPSLHSTICVQKRARQGLAGGEGMEGGREAGGEVGREVGR